MFRYEGFCMVLESTNYEFGLAIIFNLRIELKVDFFQVDINLNWVRIMLLFLIFDLKYL